jgi:ABC-type transporter Mla MlaB component
MPAPPLAHLGHWYVSLPVFMGPVLLLAIALKIQTWRESRHGSDLSGKRSSVTTTHAEDKTTVTVTGPLDYPALLELEVELGKIARTPDAILLDLGKLTAADEEAAWSLCDIISRTRHADGQPGREDRLLLLVSREPAMHALRRACAAEGVQLADETAA